MDHRQQIRDFLLSRRGRVTPQEVGLPATPGSRRVPGLRREEVAALAGVSIDYYTRLERGAVVDASQQVVDGLCRALTLDHAERAHLTDLIRAGSSARRPARRNPSRRAPASVQRVLDSMGSAPAFVSNSRLDLVATNELCAALYAHLDEHTGSAVNLARYTILDPRAKVFYRDWEQVAEMTVALLRTSAGRDPDDRQLTDLIGELVTRSNWFGTHWAAHDVQRHTSGVKRMHHPLVGDLELQFDSMELAVDPSLTITVYTTEAGFSSEDAIRQLGDCTTPTTAPTIVRETDAV